MDQRVLTFFKALIVLFAIGSPGIYAAKRYFPSGALDSDAASDLPRNSWYSRHLRAMGEPVLQPSQTTRAFRFTWLRTFHHPVSIRVVMSNGKAKLFATELSGQGGYEPGHVSRQNVINLSIEQFSQIERGISNNGFWQRTEPTQNNALVLDGAERIIEGPQTNTMSLAIGCQSLRAYMRSGRCS